MRVPAFVQPDLYIGRSFDAKDSSPGINLFASEVSTITEKISQFCFQYKVISKSEKVNDLLDISGELSLKLKADLLKVSAGGQYLTDTERKEGTTEILAVLKCTTEKVVLDSSSKPREGIEKLGGKRLGTHYVRSVVYGGEMVASLKFRSSSASSKQEIMGKAEGELPVPAQPVNVGFKAQLNKLASECKSDSDLEIKYYATHLPDRLPMTMDDLVKTIEEFPKMMKVNNNGRGVPVKFELQPLGNLLLPCLEYKENVAVIGAISEMEERFDDLLLARSLATKYLANAEQENDVLKNFFSQVNKLVKQFRKMISGLSVCGDEDQFDACIKAYTEALDGHDIIGKFENHWRNNVAKTLKPVGTLKLPEGKALTIALLGKTGNGKSATGNQIVGRYVFEESSSPSSVTQKCQYEQRSEERVIEVIDTPGVLDTSIIVKEMHASSGKCFPRWIILRRSHSRILQEVAKMFAMAPAGFHAVCVVVKYGEQFTLEDYQALELLLEFLGEEAIAYMTFVLTHADTARRDAKKAKKTVDEIVQQWISGLPECVQDFIKRINNRVVLFDNLLTPEEHPDDHTKQVTKLLETVDTMIEGRQPYVNTLTGISHEVLDEHIKKAMDAVGLTADLERLENEKKMLEEQLNEQEKGKEKPSKIVEIRQLVKTIDAELEKAGKKKKEVEDEQVEHQSRSTLDNKDSGKTAISKKPVRTLKLPEGKALTIALLGKTGNGKSATGNQIVGRDVFEESSSASSVTQKCKDERRREERVIRVIDTPGVLDTSIIEEMHASSGKCFPRWITVRRNHSRILQEVAKIFAMAPDGFHAVCVVVKYGEQFTLEDYQALEMLLKFLGEEAIAYMTLVLTHGDTARRAAKKAKKTVDEIVQQWISGLPEGVQDFIKQINNRVVLFDNLLTPEEHPDDHTKQVTKLLETVDTMIEGRQPYVNTLTGVSREVLDEHIKKAMDAVGLTADLERLENEKKMLEEQLNEQEKGKGKQSMMVPAFVQPDLSIGRSFDAKDSSPGINLFASEVSTITEDINQLSFQYKVISKSEDVRDLLDISGELSLKVKAGLLTVSGSGQYLTDSKRKEGTTEILAVLKCTTEKVVLDSSSKPREGIEKLGGKRLGTHYVRSVVYGGEMVASVKLKSSSTSSSKQKIKEKAEGELSTEADSVSFKAQHDKLDPECKSDSDLEIACYATHLPERLPTTMEELVKTIEEFPKRMKDINNGRGIPLKFELQPLGNLLLPCLKYKENVAVMGAISEIEERFDDLLLARSLASKYLANAEQENDVVQNFLSQVNKLIKQFREMISRLNVCGDEEQFDACIEAYTEALDGHDVIGKFENHWSNVTNALKPVRTLKLPEGKALTIALLGKTGNGKSATGNQIVGRYVFEESSSASSVTQKCKDERRREERVIRVIDTPGVLDTSIIEEMHVSSGKCFPPWITVRRSHSRILQEVAKIFAMAPDGFHAVCVVVKYGEQFTLEDYQTLEMLLKFVGEEAIAYMTFVLTHGDTARRDAKKAKKTVDEIVQQWISGLPEGIQDFIKQINNRVVLFDNLLTPEEHPDDHTKQVTKLLETVDTMIEGRQPYVNTLTGVSREVLDEHIKKAMDAVGLTADLERLENEKKMLEEQLNEQEKGKGKQSMSVPAFVQPDLSIGRSFDAKDSSPGVNLFASEVSTITEDINQLSFQYKVISKSEDVRDLLDISGELSLKVKAGLLTVSGSGQYLTDSERKEGTTEILAVLKCTTEKVVLDSSSKPREGIEKLGGKRLGTHYVRSVVYGGEMVASVKLKSSSTSSSKQKIKEKAEGELSTEADSVSIKAQHDKLDPECKSDSDLEIACYATHLPERLPTTMEELVKTIEEFPKRMKDINNGRGIPLQFELQPLGNLLLPCLKYKENVAVLGAISEMEERLDDLLLARSLASNYLANAEQDIDEVKIFLSQVNKLIKQFRKMISGLSVCGDEDQFDACIKAYTEALDGHDIIGKFENHWRNNVAKALVGEL